MQFDVVRAMNSFEATRSSRIEKVTASPLIPFRCNRGEFAGLFKPREIHGGATASRSRSAASKVSLLIRECIKILGVMQRNSADAINAAVGTALECRGEASLISDAHPIVQFHSFVREARSLPTPHVIYVIINRRD